MRALEAHYATLGLPLSAGIDRIRSAYKQRSLEMHPDRPNGNAEAFKKIHQSYTVLTRRLERKTTVAGTTTAAAPRPSTAGVGSGRPRAATQFSTKAAAAHQQQQIPPPAPLGGTAKMPVKALLPDRRTIFVFDGSKESIKHNGLSHGDLIKLPSGAQGVVIGVAGQGQCYWWPEGVTTATFCGKVPFVFRLVGRAGPPGGAAPRTPLGSSSNFHRDAAATNDSFSSLPSSTANTSFRPAASHEDVRTDSNPKRNNSAAAMSSAMTLEGLEKEEAAKRSKFLACLEVYYAQCRWHAKLPNYAPHDRVYNTQGSPLYK